MADNARLEHRVETAIAQTWACGPRRIWNWRLSVEPVMKPPEPSSITWA